MRKFSLAVALIGVVFIGGDYSQAPDPIPAKAPIVKAPAKEAQEEPAKKPVKKAQKPRKPKAVPQPTITAPTTVKTGDVVVLALNEIKEARVVWIADGIDFKITDKTRDIIDTAGGVIEFRTIAASSVVFIAPDPGTYTFTCLVIPHDYKQAIKQTKHVVTVEGRQDQDQGQDDEIEPKPDPKPNEWLKTDYLVVVEESEDRSVDQSKLFGSEFWKRIGESGDVNRPLVYDKDSKQGKGFIAEADVQEGYKTIPFFVVMDKNGRFKRSFPATWDESEIKQILGIE